MKKIVPKVIFILSFIPYIFILFYGVYSAFFGFKFFGTAYGFEGFKNSIVIMTVLLCYYPVIPICLTYQFTYSAVLTFVSRKITLRVFLVILLVLTVIAVSFASFY